MREPKVPAFFVPLHSPFYSLFVIMLAMRCIACEFLNINLPHEREARKEKRIKENKKRTIE